MALAISLRSVNHRAESKTSAENIRRTAPTSHEPRPWYVSRDLVILNSIGGLDRPNVPNGRRAAADMMGRAVGASLRLDVSQRRSTGAPSRGGGEESKDIPVGIGDSKPTAPRL